MMAPPNISNATVALLERAHSPTSARRIHDEKIAYKPLFLAPSLAPALSVDARTARRQRRELQNARKRRRPKPLSAAEKRRYGVHDIPREQIRYDLYKGLNELWNGYMCEILGVGGARLQDISAGADGNTIATADMHGAAVKVVKCACTGRVGIEGIVVKESKSMLDVITKSNCLKSVPKEGTVFRVTIRTAVADETIVVEVDGDALKIRPAERASRKWKLHLRLDT